MLTERAKKPGRTSEDLAGVTRDSYRAVVGRAFAVRESNARITRNFFEDTLEALQKETEHNRRVMEELADQPRRQREALAVIARETSKGYGEFLNPPFNRRP